MSYRTTWNNLTTLNLVFDNLNWLDFTWIELIWLELNWIYLTWINLNWIELTWLELIWLELNWLDLNWLIWLELNWLELTWLDLQLQDQVDSLEKQTSEVVERNHEEEHRLRREKGPFLRLNSIKFNWMHVELFSHCILYIISTVNHKFFSLLLGSALILVYYFSYFRPSGKCSEFKNISIRRGHEFQTDISWRIEEIVCSRIDWICSFKRYVSG